MQYTRLGRTGLQVSRLCLGTMTYGNMDHIHVDIGRHFVSLVSGRSWGWPSN